MELDLNKILKSNLNTKYPHPKPWPGDPAKTVGPNHPKFLHPDWDCLKEGFTPTAMRMTDFTIIKNNGLYHIFTTPLVKDTVPNWPGQTTYIFHSTTSDFQHWTNHPPIFYVDPKNPWEEAHIWPPYALGYKDGFVLIYAAMDHDDCQCLCLATSKDLFNWEKYENNPIIRPGELSWTHKRDDGKVRHCRDPHVIKYKGNYLLYYCTYCADGYSAVGLAVSKDLTDWVDLGPCFKRDASAPWMAESPLVFEKNDKYYLVVSASPGITCFQSDDPTCFHNAKQLTIACTGITSKDIQAPEIIETGRENTWLIAFYTLKKYRLFLGIMTLVKDAVHIIRIENPRQLKSFLPKEGKDI